MSKNNYYLNHEWVGKCAGFRRCIHCDLVMEAIGELVIYYYLTDRKNIFDEEPHCKVDNTCGIGGSAYLPD